jgi:hypothetical protein
MHGKRTDDDAREADSRALKPRINMKSMIRSTARVAALALATPALAFTVWPDVDFEWYANVGKYDARAPLVIAQTQARPGYIWTPERWETGVEQPEAHRRALGGRRLLRAARHLQPSARRRRALGSNPKRRALGSRRDGVAGFLASQAQLHHEVELRVVWSGSWWNGTSCFTSHSEPKSSVWSSELWPPAAMPGVFGCAVLAVVDQEIGPIRERAAGCPFTRPATET